MGDIYFDKLQLLLPMKGANDSGQQAHLRVNGIEIGTQPFTFSCLAAYPSSAGGYGNDTKRCQR